MPGLETPRGSSPAAMVSAGGRAGSGARGSSAALRRGLCWACLPPGRAPGGPGPAAGSRLGSGPAASGGPWGPARVRGGDSSREEWVEGGNASWERLWQRVARIAAFLQRQPRTCRVCLQFSCRNDLDSFLCRALFNSAVDPALQLPSCSSGHSCVQSYRGAACFDLRYLFFPLDEKQEKTLLSPQMCAQPGLQG